MITSVHSNFGELFSAATGRTFCAGDIVWIPAGAKKALSDQRWSDYLDDFENFQDESFALVLGNGWVRTDYRTNLYKPGTTKLQCIRVFMPSAGIFLLPPAFLHPPVWLLLSHDSQDMEG